MTTALLRAVWVAAATAVAAFAVVAIVIVAGGDFGDTEWRTLLSLIAVFLPATAAVAALELLDRRGFAPLGIVILAAAAAELVALLLAAWKARFGDGGNGYALEVAPITLAWVIATIVVGTLALVADDRRLRVTVFPAVSACAVAGAAVATALIRAESNSEAWGKTLAVLAILMVAGYLLTPLLERLVRPSASPRATGADRDRNPQPPSTGSDPLEAG